MHGPELCWSRHKFWKNKISLIYLTQAKATRVLNAIGYRVEYYIAWGGFVDGCCMLARRGFIKSLEGPGACRLQFVGKQMGSGALRFAGVQWSFTPFFWQQWCQVRQRMPQILKQKWEHMGLGMQQRTFKASWALEARRVLCPCYNLCFKNGWLLSRCSSAVSAQPGVFKVFFQFNICAAML